MAMKLLSFQEYKATRKEKEMDNCGENKKNPIVEVEQLVREAGFPVHIDTEYCLNWLAKHPSCQGCESAEGCGRASAVVITMMMAALHKAASIDDFISQAQWVARKTKQLLDSTKTLDEIKAYKVDGMVFEKPHLNKLEKIKQYLEKR